MQKKGRSNITMGVLVCGLAVLVVIYLNERMNIAPAQAAGATNATSSRIASAHLGTDKTGLPQEKSELPAFLSDGWTTVEESPPNEELLKLSPKLLPEHSQEIYEQLSSGAIGPRHISNMAILFAQSREEKIRYRVIENLGTINVSKSEQTLRELYPSSTADERVMIIGLLHPLEYRDSHQFLIQIGNSEEKSEQKLALNALASAHLFSGNVNFENTTLAQLSASAKEKYFNIQTNINNFAWTRSNKLGRDHE